MKKIKSKVKLHSVHVAFLCYEIAKQRGLDDIITDAVWAGLLHDIMKGRKKYQDFWIQIFESKSHANRGEKIAKEELKLGKSISNAIGKHKSKKKDILKSDDLTKILFIADKTSKMYKKNYRPKCLEKFEELECNAFNDDIPLDDCINFWFDKVKPCLKNE